MWSEEEEKTKINNAREEWIGDRRETKKKETEEAGEGKDSEECVEKTELRKDKEEEEKKYEEEEECKGEL